MIRVVEKVSGWTTGAGGVTTAAVAGVEHAEPTWLNWLNENAVALGLLFTAGTFFVYCISTFLRIYLDYKKKKD